MASEMIERIYDAEKQAQLAVDKATETAREIVEKAKLDAQNFANELVNKAKLDAEALINNARANAQQRMDEENDMNLSKARELRENAKKNEKAGIEEVVKIIIPRR